MAATWGTRARFLRISNDFGYRPFVMLGEAAGQAYRIDISILLCGVGGGPGAVSNTIFKGSAVICLARHRFLASTGEGSVRASQLHWSEPTGWINAVGAVGFYGTALSIGHGRIMTVTALSEAA
ncbi:MAG: hypothetical protein GEU91_17115 [Rhizobiales bacterium]|nr:hypothetical protein [Hyphomicrobiales bacterium]